MSRELPEGFAAWRGGKNPAPGRRVRVIFAGSNVPARVVYEADKLDWNHASSGPNIIAYQVEGAVNNVARIGLAAAQATPANQAFRADAIELLRKHGGAMQSIELLALAAHLVGQIIALQDQRKVTPQLALHIVQQNIEAGNAEVLAALSTPQGQG
jgi:hypothetical protein